MNLGLEGKYVLITGACQGIGLSTAEEFLKEGAYVCITGRDELRLQKAEKYLLNNYSSDRIQLFCGDATCMTDIGDLLQMIRLKWGRLDVIVSNIGSGKPLDDNPLSVDEWIRLFEINLFGSIRLVEVFQGLLKQSEGNIVMISSIVSRQVFGTSYAYAASKNSIITFAKYLAKDMAKDKIRVNCVLPGNVLFDGGRWEEILHEKKQKVIENINATVPMQRFGKPEEIAAGIVFLASEKASFITGSLLTIDGGQTGIIG